MIRQFSAEVLKIRTTKMWWGLLLGMLAVTALFIAPDVATTPHLVAGKPNPYQTISGFSGLISRGAFSGLLFAIALGVTAVAGEFRHQQITSTLLATQSRPKVVGAKLAAYGGMALAYGILTIALAVALSAMILSARHFTVPDLTSSVLMHTYVGVVIAVALYGALGVGVGTVVTNQVAGMIGAIAWVLIVETLVTGLLVAIHWSAVVKYLPGSGAFSLANLASENAPAGTHLFGQVGGLVVLIVWTAVWAAGGAWLLSRRDIS